MAKFFIFISALVLTSLAGASGLQGRWISEDGKVVRFVQDQGEWKLWTRSYYQNGAPSDYLFSFPFFVGFDEELSAGKKIPGAVDSFDGLYGCRFAERASVQILDSARVQINFVLLGFHWDRKASQCVIDQRYLRSQILRRY